MLSNQLYDAALLTRGYTQHAPRPYIDSENNNKRCFIKISLINKGMDFIDLPSIFRDNRLFQPLQRIFKILKHP